MLRTYDLRQKEVINIRTAEKLGFIRDVEIDFESGCIDAVIVPKRKNILNILSSEREYEISWADIVKIGREVVLVDFGAYEEIKKFKNSIEKSTKKVYNDIKPRIGSDSHEMSLLRIFGKQGYRFKTD